MENVCKKFLVDFKNKGDNEVCGYIKSKEEYEAFLNELTLNGFSFSTRTSGAYTNSQRIIFVNGYPVINSRHIYLQCSHGELYYETNKAKRPKLVKDHHYVRKKGVPTQNTKKLGCRSKIHVKIRNVFVDYGVNPSNQTLYNKTKTTRIIKLKIALNAVVKKETWFFIQACVEHNHTISKQQLPMHQKLKSTIGELVESGVTSIPEIKVHLNEKVKEMFKDKPAPDSLNSSFFPKHATIYEHVYRNFFSTKVSNSDQETLENKKLIWKNEKKIQRGSLRKHEKNNLVLLRRRLKSMLDLSYKIEDGEYLEPLLDNLSTVKKELSCHQKKELIKNKICKQRKKDQTITVSPSSKPAVPLEQISGEEEHYELSVPVEQIYGEEEVLYEYVYVISNEDIVGEETIQPN